MTTYYRGVHKANGWPTAGDSVAVGEYFYGWLQLLDYGGQVAA